MIETKNLIKNYYLGQVEVKVIKGINIKINNGEFVAITGISGAGKSTLLYQLSLLDSPTSGKIFIDGQDVSEFGETKKTNFRLNNLGFVFQESALIPELTAEENVFLPMLMKGYKIKKCRDLAKESLEKLNMGDKLKNLPSQLSGGQQQRVAIARGIINKPKVLFADEPTANLDSKTSQTVLDAFKQLNNEGQTIVMVTHEKIYANEADRVIEILDGKILKDKKINKNYRIKK